ncbi:MAG: ATP-dependent DNA helicase RecG [Anaerolineae bacterium]|nr:ATP-dependent DNA helicase RecG [Anaerolineae bacterium]
MPSALETLVKILKLERDTGYKNTAVIGGIAAYAQGWQEQAHTQARKPEHHQLVDEISERLSQYDELKNRNERHNTVSYILDRITGRIPAPTAPASEVTAQQPEKARQPEQERMSAPAQSESKSKKSPSSRPEKRGGKKSRSPGDGRRAQENLPSSDSFGSDGERTEYATYGGDVRVPTKRDIPTPPRLERPPRKPRPQLDPEQARATMHGLEATVENIHRVGTKTASILNKLGIETINDLLLYLPRRYDDYTQLIPIAKLQPNTQVTIIGVVRHTEVRISSGGRKDYAFVIDDGSATLSVTMFGQGQFYMQQRIRIGQQLVLRGITSVFRDRLQMTNPDWEELDPDDLQLARIVPVYSLTEGLRAKTLRDAIRQALDYWAERIPDYIPEATLERADLADLGWALNNLHFPESWEHLHHAKRRYIFDELLLLQLAILGNRFAWQATPADPLSSDDAHLDSVLQAIFPYALTGAQRRSIDDIRRDIAKPIPMNRLLQGDVGSGKTAVAIAALAITFANGKQAALMAPTGILAEQHFRNISAALAQMPGERQPVVALLTGSVTAAERDRVYAGLADGSIDIVIGTHAVIQSGVEFADLALAIIDEQHRFGVEQRGALRGKGKNPHLLIMTATPIPRTLALTIHADLDLSIIDEMPPGRTPISTKVIPPTAVERSYVLIEEQLDLGRQAFIVYPLVEASDKIEAAAATEAYHQLKQVFYRHKVGLLHGRMKPAEKDAIMADFSQGEFDVLVTTSVAEVGVDIPNATVILIEGANRFGLAQLHQFRGRVGRGGYASYCLLVCDTDVPEARERLSALERFNDGFKLAEIDWKLRGAGDLVGTRQSGKNALQLMEDMSPELVELAQREARTIFEEDPELRQQQHQLLAQRVHMLHDARSDIS